MESAEIVLRIMAFMKANGRKIKLMDSDVRLMKEILPCMKGISKKALRTEKEKFNSETEELDMGFGKMEISQITEFMNFI